MFQLQVLHLLKYIYIYIFDDGYKGDPQKALLKAASMRATLRCGAWCFWNAAYATGEVQRRVLEQVTIWRLGMGWRQMHQRETTMYQHEYHLIIII